MNEPVTKASLIEILKTERDRWEALLATVDVARMTVPAINNGWSIKDTIGHVTYYERWLLDWLEAAARGQVTLATHRDLLAVDARNAIVFRENRDRALSDVLTESREVFDRLLLLIELLPELDLIDAQRYERYILPFWETPQPLWKCIAENTFEHYAEHADSILGWLKKFAADLVVA